MIVAKSIAACRAARGSLGRLAFVPTMGALHAGHLSLVEHGRRHAKSVAVSIFVNPTQFGPNEDFHRYPRPLDEDLARCEAAGVQLVFCPTVDEMYPQGAPTATVDVPTLTTILEGAARPGHFSGVCQVVSKLFNIVEPDVACFGEKDFQQLAVLQAMTGALNFRVTIVPCPTLRDPDGLAMSSRNRYLSDDERARALAISRGLFQIAKLAQGEERRIAVLQETLYNTLSDARLLEHIPTALDYAAIVDRATLAECSGSLDDHAAGVQAVVAMRVGRTRLIDNIALTAPRDD